MIIDYVRLKGLFVDYRDTFNMAFFLVKKALKQHAASFDNLNINKTSYYIFKLKKSPFICECIYYNDPVIYHSSI